MSDHLIKTTTALAVIAVASVAAIISCEHAYEHVSTHGEHGLTARLLPFTVDGLIWAASMVVLVGSFELLMMLIRSTHRVSVEHVPRALEHEFASHAEHDAPLEGPDAPILEHAVREWHHVGHSQRAIARDLKIDRRKVKRIVEHSAETKIVVAGL